MMILKQAQAILISAILASSVPVGGQDQAASAPTATVSAAPSAQELQQLVAPIALYPDALVGQVLAGATYPTQIVEADRWAQEHSSLKGEQLAAEIDKQSWDPSVKGLAQFPSVLQKMSKNLSWTSSLGDAYFNDPQGVMSAIQVLRKQASDAGNLKSTPEQTVKTEGQTIIIQPSDPQVVYVPEYSPTVVYGTAIAPYPGYSGWDYAAASALSFGAGMFMGAAMSGGWGWGGWDMDWHGGNVNFNRNTYRSNSNTFSNRNTRYGQSNRTAAGGGAAARTGGAGSRTGMGARSSPGSQSWGNRERSSGAASKGFGQSGQSSRGTSGSAFSGARQGGSARMDSSRGRSSFSGGGGGFRGGGGRAGGGRRR